MKHDIFNTDTYAYMPWKNGLGTTCEIARKNKPDSEDFAWRVSIADVKNDGPFSNYNGYTRVICTLEGAGMYLNVDGVRSPDLLPYDPYVFSGASQTEGLLLDGAIRDFNLIYAPDLYHARFQWVNVTEPYVFCSEASDILIYSVSGVNAACNEFAVAIPAQGTLKIENPESVLRRMGLTADQSQQNNYCCIIELTRR